jgi:hypothetical protein
MRKLSERLTRTSEWRARGLELQINQKSNVWITRWSRDKTLVLETRFATSDGGVTLAAA